MIVSVVTSTQTSPHTPTSSQAQSSTASPSSSHIDLEHPGIASLEDSNDHDTQHKDEGQ